MNIAKISTCFLLFSLFRLFVLYWDIATWQCCDMFQVSSRLGHTYTCVSIPPQIPSHPGCHVTLIRVPWHLLSFLKHCLTRAKFKQRSSLEIGFRMLHLSEQSLFLWILAHWVLVTSFVPSNTFTQDLKFSVWGVIWCQLFFSEVEIKYLLD